MMGIWGHQWVPGNPNQPFMTSDAHQRSREA
jgi:hypothetical protein